jgi:hypothetical protein
LSNSKCNSNIHNFNFARLFPLDTFLDCYHRLLFKKTGKSVAILIPNDKTKTNVEKSMTMRRISVPILTLVLTALLFVASLPRVNAGLPRRAMMDGKSEDQEFGRPVSSTSTSQSSSSLKIKENLASLYPTLRRLQQHGNVQQGVGRSGTSQKERYLGVGVGRLGDEEYQKTEAVGGYKGNSTDTAKKAGGSRGRKGRGAFGKGLKKGGSKKMSTTTKGSGGKAGKKKSCKSKKSKKKKKGKSKKGSKGDHCEEKEEEEEIGSGGDDGGNDDGEVSNTGGDNEPDTGVDNGDDGFEGHGSETPTVRGYNLVFAAVSVTERKLEGILTLFSLGWIGFQNLGCSNQYCAVVMYCTISNQRYRSYPNLNTLRIPFDWEPNLPLMVIWPLTKRV